MNAPDEQTESMRLFYALWPDEATRKALTGWRPLLKGRPVPVQNLHITLAFLGNQTSRILPGLLSILHRLDSPPILLKLDRIGYFAKSRVAWAGMSAIPPELIQLHASLRQELEQMHIRHDDRPRFVPHLTLARNATHLETKNVEPVEWLANHLALVHSPMNGSPYRLLASKTLTRS